MTYTRTRPVIRFLDDVTAQDMFGQDFIFHAGDTWGIIDGPIVDNYGSYIWVKSVIGPVCISRLDAVADKVCIQ